MSVRQVIYKEGMSPSYHRSDMECCQAVSLGDVFAGALAEACISPSLAGAMCREMVSLSGSFGDALIAA